MGLDIEYLNRWLGNEIVIEDVISAEITNRMNVTLNREPTFKNGDELPPAWHWMYHHDPQRAENLGVEGHAKLGGFMPPVSYGGDDPPLRMWAGGRFVFARPILIGDRVTKRSTIKSITPKTGRSGRMCFVVVGHELLVGGERCLLEDQTIVYREPVVSTNRVVTAQMARDDGEFSAEYTPDPIMLFRYSALTFNGHRIHYDVDFCRNHEGYPDLVVHGPLTATLILDLYFRQPNAKRIRSFSYRGRSPLFNPNPFVVHGRADGDAWATNHEGGLAMTAQLS
ncbi:MAG: FAS1-like dehydratase domain-containing protein [Candidatus Promineifilaceae bacterium]